jgi:polysaccharide biosynthesis protein PslA
MHVRDDVYVEFGIGSRAPVQVPHDTPPIATSPQSGLSLLLIDGTPATPARTTRRLLALGAKRALDIVLAGAALIALLPLLAAIALLVRVTSPGPALFWQDRVGFNGRIFRIVKFRTVRTECSDPSGVSQLVCGDGRATPFGEFLRDSSLDELPQLFNILVGDMSIVGPRPHPAGQLAAGRPYAEVVPYYNQRWAMRPGLTGWAQVNGLRGPTRHPVYARARVDHDIAYIQNFSLLLDLRVIALTVWRGLHGELTARDPGGERK